MRLSYINLSRVQKKSTRMAVFSFINKLLNGNKGMACWDSLLPAARNSLYSTSNIIRSLIGIQTAGECGYTDIEKFRGDVLFREVAGGKVPSEESSRQRLDRLASSPDEWRTGVERCVASQLAVAGLTSLRAGGMELLPVHQLPWNPADRSAFLICNTILLKSKLFFLGSLLIAKNQYAPEKQWHSQGHLGNPVISKVE